MKHAAFVLSAYAVAVAGVLGLVIQSWTAMRRAERAAGKGRER